MEAVGFWPLSTLRPNVILVHLVVNWYIPPPGPVLVCCTEKNLATLVQSHPSVAARWPPGLPDGLFPNQTPQFWYNLEGLWPDNFDIFHDHSVFFVAIYFILWPFGICCAHLLYYPHFGKLYQGKSGNPDGRSL
jgi:hypothetical protein